jgi:hypothetical protein
MEEDTYNIKLVKVSPTRNRKDTRRQIEVTRRDNRLISLDEVKSFYDDLLQEGKNPDQICIVGLNAERLTTIKSFDDKEVFDEFDEEYLQNKPEGIRDLLTHYSRVELILY